jgi:hypothetical protein
MKVPAPDALSWILEVLQFKTVVAELITVTGLA